MAGHDEALLTVSDLCKTYGSGDGRVKALDHVSFSVSRGELVTVLGKSGCGKSTLLNMLGGMDSFDSGSVCFAGKELGRMSDRELTSYRRDVVGFVFQSFNLIEGLTAEENVSLTVGRKGSGAVKEALSVVGLSDMRKRYPSQLSGGQQQRVSIARALAKDPEFFLCDEPTGALDSETGKVVLKCLERLVRKYGKTMIIVTHNSEIARISDRIIRMKNGQIIMNEKNLSVETAEDIEW
jgi:putative ABC transport system ATP-binding protein